MIVIWYCHRGTYFGRNVVWMKIVHSTLEACSIFIFSLKEGEFILLGPLDKTSPYNLAFEEARGTEIYGNPGGR